jgi:hypothetical protein
MIVKLTDIFGNAVTTGSGILSVAVLGGGGTVNGATSAVTATVYNTTDKGWGYKVASTTAAAFGVSVKIVADPAQVTGFPVPAKSVFVSLNSSSAATAVATLESQVNALTAQVKARVSKKKYNTLARKWNAAFPSQKVALKK